MIKWLMKMVKRDIENQVKKEKDARFAHLMVITNSIGLPGRSLKQ